MSSKLVFKILGSGVAARACLVSMGAGAVSVRHASEIPPNSLFIVEWYPRGCGHASGVALDGSEETLGTCSKFDGMLDSDAPDSAAICFVFSDDGRHYKWQIFSTNGCETHINSGDHGGCFPVPKDTNIGAVIVST